jgi:decaprenyl-phosphate phosphoribosyltransferase
MLRPLIQSMRPHQWVKNAFVLAPLVFSQNLTSGHLLLRGFGAFVAFCLGSGAIYLLNDLMDRESDREHPVKRERPIASGQLPVGVAKVSVGVALSAGLVIAFVLSPWFALILLGYALMNLAYSTGLKHVAFVDAAIIALGFLLRISGGAVAIGVPVSAWLLVCTFLLSMYLALGKRRHELLTVGAEGGTRKVLQSYRSEHLDIAMWVAALVTASSYTGYTFDTATVEHFETRLLPLTTPFILFGLVRFFVLTQRKDFHSPTELMIRDKIFVANLVAWALVTTGLIYL